MCAERKLGIIADAEVSRDVSSPSPRGRWHLPARGRGRESFSSRQCRRRPGRTRLRTPVAEMRWRNIGPHRAGRTKAAVGVPSQPNVFYIGVCNGGVWKTTDYGRTWTPIFDDQPTGSIGAIAVAPSDPEHHLRRQRRRPAAARPLDRRRHLQVDRRRQDVDAPRPARRPADSADRRRSAQPEPALRRRARPSRTARTPSAASSARPTAARRSRRCSTRTRTPARVDVAFDPVESRTRLRRAVGGAAGTVGERRRGTGPGSGIFKSTDGGTTWRPLTKGLPTFEQDGLGRIGITVAPSRPEPRSSRPSDAPRGGGHLPLGRCRRDLDAGERRDPRVARTARRTSPRSRSTRRTRTSSSSASIVTWKSTDGGKTFDGVPRRARRRRLPAALDQPEQPRHHPDGVRPGRDRHRQRRRDVELLVQPADGAVLPRDHRQRVPVPRVQRPAGERIGVRLEPRRRRADHVPRLAARSASRSTATSRPIRSTPTSCTAAR